LLYDALTNEAKSYIGLELGGRLPNSDFATLFSKVLLVGIFNIRIVFSNVLKQGAQLPQRDLATRYVS